ncbi:hypothetical protein [Lacisediminimonas profundi]|uniref:hypothetical protein n=1 Tax=Lacisediminimonas profundi TaxID=2603856 RepID=UPI001386A363|nr:hypothetical protein [Lacisediminimonas profundi]
MDRLGNNETRMFPQERNKLHRSRTDCDQVDGAFGAATGRGWFGGCDMTGCRAHA